MPLPHGLKSTIMTLLTLHVAFHVRKYMGCSCNLAENGVIDINFAS